MIHGSARRRSPEDSIASAEYLEILINRSQRSSSARRLRRTPRQLEQKAKNDQNPIISTDFHAERYNPGVVRADSAWVRHVRAVEHARVTVISDFRAVEHVHVTIINDVSRTVHDTCRRTSGCMC